MNIVDVQNMQDVFPVDEDVVRVWAEQSLEALGRFESELSVVLVDDRYIRGLNRQYLGRDKPTNVISFPQLEGEGSLGEHLGDIVISVERAVAEAAEVELSLDERLMQLLVHGICHLCGYDHEDVEEGRVREMEAKEQEIADLLTHA